MTAADLKRLDEIRNELKCLKSRLESLRNASVVSATNYSQMGGKCSTGDPVAKAACSASDIEYSMYMLRCEGCGILKNVEPDSLCEALTLFYLECLPSWTEVSRVMGKHRNYAGRLYRNFKEQLDNGSTNGYN